MILLKRVNAAFWAFLAPHWASIRDFLLKCHIIWHESGRQRFHIGWLRADKTPDEFMHHLQDIGFHNHSLAWVDEEEYFGLRIVDKQNANFQYHLRIFNDGEVRGHYEWTTEANWYKHFHEIGMEQKRDEFMAFLGDWIVADKSGAIPQADRVVNNRILGVRVKTGKKRYPKARPRRFGARQRADSGEGQ